MDRGFEQMIPRPKRESVSYIINQEIKFSFFGKEFCLKFSVNKKE